MEANTCLARKEKCNFINVDILIRLWKDSTANASQIYCRHRRICFFLLFLSIEGDKENFLKKKESETRSQTFFFSRKFSTTTTLFLPLLDMGGLQKLQQQKTNNTCHIFCSKTHNILWKFNKKRGKCGLLPNPHQTPPVFFFLENIKYQCVFWPF